MRIGSKIRTIYDQFSDTNTQAMCTVYNTWPDYELEIKPQNGMFTFTFTSIYDQSRPVKQYSLSRSEVETINTDKNSDNLDVQLERITILQKERNFKQYLLNLYKKIYSFY